jgi:two-component sensor histidine kinase
MSETTSVPPAERLSTGLTLIVSADTDAPGVARAAVDRLPHLEADTRETLRLLISELVTNSLLHAGLSHLDAIRVAISIDRRVRVEVTDGGAGFGFGDVHRAQSTGHGWGLALVERMTSAWRVECGPPTRVWFELEPPAGGG